MPDQEDKLYAMRHSAAHVLATAVMHLFPDVKFGVGPVIDNGFYYDFDLGDSVLTEADLEKIEKEMTQVIAANQQFVKSSCPIDEAIAWAKDNDQPYKLELLNDLKNSGTTDVKELKTDIDNGQESGVDSVSFYTNGDFKDLCRGPHVESTSGVGAFKLTKVSGAYWRGSEHNKQLQRIYGVAFSTDEELKNYLKAQSEAKNNDHRKIGQEMDLFVISQHVGSGLPLFTPRGTVLRDELNRYSQDLRKSEGYQSVWSPHIAKKELYEISGHWAKFGDEWLTVDSKETKDKLVMKPMSCPHHQQIYASKPRSYRDLPIKYLETATVYRDEKAGELMGLARVRAITQDDTHVFCKPDQIDEILMTLVNIVKEFYKTIGMDLRVRLSFRGDGDGYLGDKKLWEQAENIITDVVKKTGLEYYMGYGEAAFYGPKIDFMATDSLGREFQLATPQLDFVQPERFGLKYADDDGTEKTPVMVHFALMGSIERFMAIYIEHTAGRFPVWLAPEQIRILTLNQTEEVEAFAKQVSDKAFELGLRLTIDNANESVGKKIREAEVMKVPYILVVGSKEIESGQVTPRVRKDLTDKPDTQPLPLEDFLSVVSKEHKNRTLKSTI